ncbi:K02A2.6-like [Cordylochernes scorpioides]|uniref:K02A2.6-like n=1 Tax=Cordylochernes scorpioides TaxID=51811 RepID=A0ABY6KR07_9ARAC|nr:K02A2.6-like [Cordylochernes scorpioides]
MLLRLQRYNLEVKYKPGKQMYISDCLSRKYLMKTVYLNDDKSIYQEIKNIKLIEFVNISTATAEQIRQQNCKDQTMQVLVNLIRKGWPKSKYKVSREAMEYWKFRDELTEQDGIIYKGQKVVIPKHYDQSYSTEFTPVIMDFWELDILEHTTSESIIECCKKNFSRHGIPETLITDNGPQFISREFQKFLKTWKVVQIINSPYHSQSNGKAESAVKYAKMLVKKAKHEQEDLWLAILEWRNIPLKDLGFSPNQALISRRT